MHGAIFSKVKLRSHQYPNWLTLYLQHKIKCLQTLQRKAKKFPSSKLQQLICEENALNNEITRAKLSFEINFIIFCRSYSIFHCIKSLAKCKSLPPTLYTKLWLAESDIYKANTLNQYFNSIFSQGRVMLPNSEDLP